LDSQPRLRVLIADDEPLGGERIAHLLEDYEDIEVVKVVEDGPQAISAIRTLRPDLVFLDIEMPGCSGLEVVREIGPEAMPTTIFVTAYDEHAAEGFQLAALDYLVKPYADERFDEALRRARKRIALESLGRLRERLQILLDLDDGIEPRPSGSYLTRIAVSMRGRVKVIPVADIDYISASDTYAELAAGSERHLVRQPLQTLEQQLDPDEFIRIHRSTIVRLDRVKLLVRGGGGQCEVVLVDGTRLKVGRTRKEELERRLGRIE
jgi:two-component system, LytTR family, response regulator